MFMLRIRFDTFCTVPVIASSAPIRRAKRISQPPQPCRLLACASRAIGVISTSEKRPESLSSCRNRSLRRASRSCSSGRAPRIAPSRLVSINSKSKTATDCATVGPQLTNNKAHNVTRYDRMIMIGPLGPSARAGVPWSFVAPRTHTVLAFVRPRFGTAPVAWDLAIVDPLLVARLDAKSLLGSAGRLIVALIGIVVVAALDRGLLRARCERPRRSRAKQRDERAAVHSITSSARARSVAGTVMPSALAVFILMTSWKRVGCSTGKSAGWAPLRILSTYTAALRKRSAYIAEYDISPPSSTNQRGTETAGTRCCSASSAARLLGRLG